MEAIHPRAAKTLRQAGIPLRVAHAFEPHDPGTLIDAEPGGPARVEMVTGLDVTELEVFEQDMVGVKGYDAEILKALTRHKVWIVAKSSNANTITHYVQGPLKRVRQVADDLAEAFPAARVRARRLGLVSAIGRDLSGLGPLRRALTALDRAGIDVVAAQENGRGVDIMLLVACDRRDDAIRALHAELVERAEELPHRHHRHGANGEAREKIAHVVRLEVAPHEESNAGDPHAVRGDCRRQLPRLQRHHVDHR
jgi:aspartate kinase